MDEMLEAARDATDRAIRASGIDRDLLVGAGVSLPVPLDLEADRVAVPVIAAWRGLRPRRAFEDLTGVSVRVENDVNAAALAELQWGGGRGVSDFVYVKVAPGIGAAIVRDGTIYRGAKGFAGEVGHNIRTGDHGPMCRCGNRGCLGPSVEMSYLLEHFRLRHGQRLTAARLIELVAEGDSEAVGVMHDASLLLGRALANLCNVLNPEAILIGGALETTREALIADVREAIDDYALRPVAEAVDVRFAELADDAEVRGALTLAPIDELQSVPRGSTRILSA
jgi:predicted NBD/HSP70 family sugar kinase